MEDIKKDLPYIKLENDNIVMGKSLYQKINESNYFSWIIAYEMLDFIKDTYNINECDLLYDFCQYVAYKYINSEEYKNLNYSGYDMFYEYISNNGGIKKMYLDYFDLQNV